MADAPPGDFLVLSQISKRYGGVRALENVDFRCGRGKIHAVLGENGAGKSTLIKIVAGVVQPDNGSITLDGRARHFASPSAATSAGVVCIFQELSLMPDLSVADNIIDRHAAETFRFDRRARPAPPSRSASGGSRLRRRQSASTDARSAAVAAPDGRDRQGAWPKAAASDPRRGDLGAHQRRRREGLCAAGAAEGAECRHPLHLAPHARGRGAGRSRLGVPQRPSHRNIRQGRPYDRRRSCN